jgi:hypothetical protein
MVQKLEVEFRFNAAILDKWFERQGEGAQAGLAYTIGCHPTLFDKLRTYGTMPNGKHLAAISTATKISMDELVIRVPKKKSA